MLCELCRPSYCRQGRERQLSFISESTVEHGQCHDMTGRYSSRPVRDSRGVGP